MLEQGVSIIHNDFVKLVLVLTTQALASIFP